MPSCVQQLLISYGSGQVRWAEFMRWTGVTNITWCKSIQATTGEIYTTLVGDTNRLWLVKSNSDGTLVWSMRLSAGVETIAGNDPCIDSSGNVYLAFGDMDTGYGGNTIMKVDSTGAVVWKKGLSYFFSNYAGAPCTVGTATMMSDGVIFQVGGKPTIPVGDPWNRYVVKTDTDGNVLWTRVDTTSSSDQYDPVRVINTGEVYWLSPNMLGGLLNTIDRITYAATHDCFTVNSPTLSGYTSQLSPYFTGKYAPRVVPKLDGSHIFVAFPVTNGGVGYSRNVGLCIQMYDPAWALVWGNVYLDLGLTSHYADMLLIDMTVDIHNDLYIMYLPGIYDHTVPTTLFEDVKVIKISGIPGTLSVHGEILWSRSISNFLQYASGYGNLYCQGETLLMSGVNNLGASKVPIIFKSGLDGLAVGTYTVDGNTYTVSDPGSWPAANLDFTTPILNAPTARTNLTNPTTFASTLTLSSDTPTTYGVVTL